MEYQTVKKRQSFTGETFRTWLSTFHEMLKPMITVLKHFYGVLQKLVKLMPSYIIESGSYPVAIYLFLKREWLEASEERGE